MADAAGSAVSIKKRPGAIAASGPQQPDLGITTEWENQKPIQPSVAYGQWLIL
jgi:hypothetical protein